MSLNAAQLVDVRRYMGYQLAGTTMVIDDNHDVVYGRFGVLTMSLFTRLNTLTPEEVIVVTDKYLANLSALEDDIFSVRDNLDTDEAAVWKHNKQEIADRSALYNRVRRQLCAFIGFEPGPGLSSGRVSLVRA